MLDRFPAFKYRYQSVPQWTLSGASSVARGVCQTGRVSTLSADVPASAGRCLTTRVGTVGSTVRCERSADPYVLRRRAPLTPGETVARYRQARRRCAACSPPPRFVTTNGASMQPESSFGVPFRLSSERMVAKRIRDEVRLALCQGNLTTCPRFNESAWTNGSFLRALLTNPGTLFLRVNATAPNAPAAASTGSGDDSAQWTKAPWVFCPTKTALRTGENCSGTISKAAWLRDRTHVCPLMVQSLSMQGDQDPMARTPFCSIDPSVSGLCQAVAKAQGLVSLAN